jgi:hypothetical protein
MTIPADSIVAHTLSRMQRSLERRTDTGDVGQERSGLLLWEMYMMRFPDSCFWIPVFRHWIKPPG